MSLSKTKFLIGLLLIPVTIVFALLAIVSSSFALSYPINPYTVFLLTLAIFGILGLIGVWLLFIFDNFRNKLKRVLTIIFLTLGIISALSVSYLTFSGRGLSDGIADFLLSWGLCFFILIIVFFAKRKLFPKL